MESCFGNYVLQKAIEISNGEERKTLVALCKADKDKIKELKIRGKWEKILEQASLN